MISCKVRGSIWDYVDQHPEQYKNLLTVLTGLLSNMLICFITRSWVIVSALGYFVTESCLICYLQNSSVLLSEARKHICSIIFWDIALQFLKIGIILPLRFICSRDVLFFSPVSRLLTILIAPFGMPSFLFMSYLVAPRIPGVFQVWISQSKVKLLPLI